jgi:hypothetical protein
VLVPNEIEACLQFRAERLTVEPELLFPAFAIKAK